MRARAAIALLALAGASSLALAQNMPAPSPPPAPSAPPAVLDPKACAPQERLGRNDLRPNTSVTTGENLSDKLARTDGVLCPPNVDPEIKLPTPPGGPMPVIPPPGSPGGDPTVRPK